MTIRAGIITVSDSRSAGTAADRATEPLREALEHAGVTVAQCMLVPDEQIEISDAIVHLVDNELLHLVLTTGGTGLGPRDVTPEATIACIDRSVPGIAEMLRQESSQFTNHAWLSRGIAGTRGHALIVNLPGSPRGAVQCAELVLPLVSHATHVMTGASHDIQPGSAQ